MEYYDPMEMKCPWCRRPSRPGFGGPPGPPPRPGYGPTTAIHLRVRVTDLAREVRRRVPAMAHHRHHPRVRVTDLAREVRRRVPAMAHHRHPARVPGGPNRPRPCTRCIRPFEAEEAWQASSPSTMPEQFNQANLSDTVPEQSGEASSPETQPQWEQPSESPAPQPQDSLFQEDEPSTPLTRYYEDDYETERDLERMKTLYPEISKELFPWIEDVCDQMEYEGSLMYDESPDQNQVRRLTSRIYGQVKEQYQPPEGEDKDEMLAMNQETWRRYPPDQNWLSDLIQTLLVDEMFRRRCRRRNTRWWS